MSTEEMTICINLCSNHIAGGTKVHVYLPYQGAISNLVGLYCTLRPDKYISVCQALSNFFQT